MDFAIPKDGEISLTLFDINGREIEKLASGIFRAGYHSVNWDASNLSSGIYFYRLNAPGYVDTKKMILLK
ncbi:T9SS type A sorting domain-containing protein [Candidatus Marinimicrobia bacterium MT.SAG.3]|nr:T9SS type A sorting domain-containing protein [Candidatus Marinimicrobia bacterium MT.SAG.3]